MTERLLALANFKEIRCSKSVPLLFFAVVPMASANMPSRARLRVCSAREHVCASLRIGEVTGAP
eukprot:14560068-Alexandrium_andersonii.AAC.1